mmetsp:Transcript_12999/g.30737  ORF Transcript_12999/g.30737 Transcript_12999/m.30737 type:complete len:93 (+) Transcript_12999:1438-1716(+)
MLLVNDRKGWEVAKIDIIKRDTSKTKGELALGCDIPESPLNSFLPSCSFEAHIIPEQDEEFAAVAMGFLRETIPYMANLPLQVMENHEVRFP